MNEMRAFRHFFRHAYDIDIDQEKLELVLKRAMLLREKYPTEVQSFLDFLTCLEREAENSGRLS